MWRNRFGRDYGSVVNRPRDDDDDDDDLMCKIQEYDTGLRCICCV